MAASRKKAPAKPKGAKKIRIKPGSPAAAAPVDDARVIAQLIDGKCTECGAVLGHKTSCSQYPANLGRRPEPPVQPADLRALQQMYDSGDFSGGRQLKEHCSYTADGECKHIAVLEKVLTHECPTCERSQKETIERYCLLHAIMVWGGGAPGRAQTELL